MTEIRSVRHGGGDLRIDTVSGRDYPSDLKNYRLIVHCGACIINRREMLTRLRQAGEAGVAISFLQGVIRRSLAPFPAEPAAFGKAMKADL